MSTGYLINEALIEACGRFKCDLSLISGKRIMYEGANGESVALCTPSASLQQNPSGEWEWWADITEVQYQLLNSYDRALVIFRLQGQTLLVCEWDKLRNYLTANCMVFNTSEGNHWKLHIYGNRIEVQGGNDISVNLSVIVKEI